MPTQPEEQNGDALIRRLSPHVRSALETAISLCVSRTHYRVEPEHILLALLETTQGDFHTLIDHLGLDRAEMRLALRQAVEGLPTGNHGRPPVFPGRLYDWLRRAARVSEMVLGTDMIRSGALVAGSLLDPDLIGPGPHRALFTRCEAGDLLVELRAVLATSPEPPALPAQEEGASTQTPPSVAAGEAPGQGEAALGPLLAKYCTDLTARARAGAIDPVFGRDAEIGQMINILARRRQNNPLCVGEPGVGKTALAEGLALRMARGDVPDFLKGQALLSLDLGQLQAGAGMRGEFERRLYGLLAEVKQSPVPIILFIDEAHMLIGAGNVPGGGDAANLIKPALARGELRTIAATTWGEYKKYFEKDAALARRFELVRLEEPSPEQAIQILRGLKPVFEAAHHVHIRQDALEAAAHLSARYIAGRQLPDKAIGVLDTACARVKQGLSGRPALLVAAEQRLALLDRTRADAEGDLRLGMADAPARLAALDGERAQQADQCKRLETQWQAEREVVDAIIQLRRDMLAGEGPVAAESAARMADLLRSLAELQGDAPLLDHEVSAHSIGQVIADWTGIPMGRLLRDDLRKLLTLSTDLGRRIVGQDHALQVIEEGLRTAKAGLADPTMPLGVFLLVGPSGVGKTETAIAIADHLFGGERFMVTINMSEFQERHTISRLIGPPPGYVGYGEGGVLTEAVRQRPYSVVLLDEVEKADLNVLNLFYQVFDKGRLNDGEGRSIDFRNTILFLTSNLATDLIQQVADEGTRPSPEELTELIRPALRAHFKPALLGRMRVVPFYPLRPQDMARIVRLKLDKVAARLAARHGLSMTVSDRAVDAVVARCLDGQSGARNADSILQSTIISPLSRRLLEMMGRGEEPGPLLIDHDREDGFCFTFSAAS
ncbi:type VI secretion system ATPase TssH [Niveispirillum irakense]|uniref:type VI secretion system ATPase TssH n=1 Tax=Niveispirillum irakense TaxID=34011 RepID=UPI0003F6B441|nr:type VI secretion system ATPase TssH [Niveispirillum irakense]